MASIASIHIRWTALLWPGVCKGHHDSSPLLCFTGQQAPPDATIAIGETPGKPKRSALKPPYGDKYGREYRGMGGLVTNVWDLWKLDRALRENRLLNADGLKTMSAPTINDFALGWFVGEARDGSFYHHHSGSVRGFLAHIYRFPSDDGCLFVLCNHADQANFHRVSKGCRQLMLGEKKPTDFPFPLDKELVAAIKGRYEEGRRKLEIEPVALMAKAQIDWGGPVTRALVAKDIDGNLRLFDQGTNPIVKFAIKDDVATNCSFLTVTFQRIKPIDDDAK